MNYFTNVSAKMGKGIKKIGVNTSIMTCLFVRSHGNTPESHIYYMKPL